MARATALVLVVGQGGLAMRIAAGGSHATDQLRTLQDWLSAGWEITGVSTTTSPMPAVPSALPAGPTPAVFVALAH